MSLRLAPLALLLAAHVAAAQASTETVFPDLACSSFEWIHTDEVERAAIVVPVVLDGESYRLQLDTGADYSMVYGDIADQRGWPVIGGFPRLVPSAEIGGMSLGPVHMLQNAGMSTDEGIHGTLGLDALVGKLTVIDYPGQRFCVMERGAATDAVWMETVWSPAELRNGKLFLPVTLDGEPLDALAFDTGSSASALFVDYEPWLAITGAADSTDATSRWVGTAWGREITVAGRPIEGRLQIGARIVPSEFASAYTELTDPEDFAGWPFPIGGLVGNAGLWDRVVVLDLGVSTRFGVVR